MLKVGRSLLISCALGLIVFGVPCRADELLRFYAADDVNFTAPGTLSGFIVFSLESAPGRGEVRILDLEGRRVLKPPYISGSIHDVATSTTSSGMVFSRTRDGGRELTLSALDGSDATILIGSDIRKYNVVLGRNPGQLVFVGEFHSLWKELFVVANDGASTPRQLTRFGGRNTTPHVNPITGAIAYSTSRNFPGWDICIFNPTTGNDTCPLGKDDDSFCRPKWSPDGSQLVYSQGLGSETNLHLYHVASRSTARLTNLPYTEYDGAWSPDGSYIVFSHNSKGSSVFELKLVRLSDGYVFPLASSSRSMRGATWTTSLPYSIDTPLPTETPEVDPTPTPTPTVEPIVTPAPTQAPAPSVTVGSIFRQKARLVVVLPDAAPAPPYAIKIQVNTGVQTLHTRRRRISVVTNASSLVRASWRRRGEKSFSAWSRWVQARAASPDK